MKVRSLGIAHDRPPDVLVSSARREERYLLSIALEHSQIVNNIPQEESVHQDVSALVGSLFPNTTHSAWPPLRAIYATPAKFALPITARVALSCEVITLLAVAGSTAPHDVAETTHVLRSAVARTQPVASSA